MKLKLKHMAFVAMLACANMASAATSLTTSDSGYSGPTLNLSAFSNGGYNFTFGPVALPGGITFTAAPGNGGNSGQGSVIGQGSYGLSSNGNFGGSATYIGVDSRTGFATLTFGTTVSSFGGYWNYSPNSGNAPVISAYDESDNLLGSYDLSVLAPISTPSGFNQFAFRGIQSDSADIKSFRFGGSYLLLAGTPDGQIPAVPEPETYAMLLAGLGLLGVVKRNRKAKQA